MLLGRNTCTKCYMLPPNKTPSSATVKDLILNGWRTIDLAVSFVARDRYFCMWLCADFLELN